MKDRIWLFIVLAVLVAFAAQGRLALSGEAAGTPTSHPPALAWNPEHRVLRRGYQGYDGVIDTYISRDQEPGTAHGSETNLHAKDGSWGVKRVLVKFDLSQIPHYMQVNEARLDLRVAHVYGGGDWRVYTYRVNKSWEEMTTWDEMGSDCYNTTLVASQTYTRTTGYGGIDITDLVQDWVANPLQNYGLLIKSASTADIRFHSSEDSEDRRPRLVVDYEIPEGVTPPPTYTPTPTLTPTSAPTSTPTPAATVISYGRYQALGGECVVTEKDNPGSTQVLLLTRGQVTQAKLQAWHQNNNGYDALLVNGVVVGQLQEKNGREKCTGRDNGTFLELDLDPAILIDGLNEITALTDAEWENDWSLESPSIIVGGQIRTVEIQQVTIPSSYDPSEQRSTIMLPIGHDTSNPLIRYPLLIALHGWGGNDFEATKWMAKACNDRGWVLASPWIRGGSEHTAGAGAQHDIIDLLDYILARPETYAVDPDRVYLVGRSMGGMIAATTAAKYPDRFAALVEWQGPTDLAAWYNYLEPFPHQLAKILQIEEDCGGPPTGAYLFDYQRRSVASMPMNLINLPTMIIHGEDDTIVPVSHGENFYDGLLAYDAIFADKFIYQGDHYTPDPPPVWDAAQILTFLSQYSRTLRPEHVWVRTDEYKSYYWLTLEYDNEIAKHWNLIDAHYDPLSQVVTIDAQDERDNPRASYVTIDLGALGLPQGASYTVEDKDLDTGQYKQSQQAPEGGRLRLRVGANHHYLTVYPYSAPQPNEVDLYYGNMGYSGVVDTTLENNPPGDNHATEDELRIATSGILARIIVRFELDGQIPTGRVIKGAQLKLHTNYSWGGNRLVKTSVYRLRHPWGPLQANWNERLSGTSWSAGGAGGADADYEAASYSSQTLAADNVVYVFDVTDLVQKWVSGEEDNYGMLLKGESGSATYKLNSSESTTNHPALYVWWADPTATPSPTATATPCPTLTPTHDWSGMTFLPAILK